MLCKCEHEFMDHYRAEWCMHKDCNCNWFEEALDK